MSIFNNIRNILKNQDGFIYALALLLIFPMFIFTITAVINISTSSISGDIDIQEGLALACKSAAMQLDSTAQAKGLIRINSVKASEQFKKALARNLNLNETTLAPNANSYYTDKIEYWLLVYNGYNDFSSSDCRPAIIYHFDGEVTTTSNVNYSGFPCQFGISDAGIVIGGGARTTALQSPGVVAVAKVECKRIGGGDKRINMRRWAAARVVSIDGTLKVI